MLAKLSLISSVILPVVSAIDASSLGGNYSCLGTFIFGRHNDRVAKPALYLTTLGAVEQVESGNFYRERYFGLDPDSNKVDSDFIINGLNAEGAFVYGETYAQCPASSVIEYSQLSFLQGLYPPSRAVNNNTNLIDVQDSEVANGTSIVGPFDGYQYVFMDVQQASSDNYFYIKGDTECPNSDNDVDRYMSGSTFQNLNKTSLEFFQSLSSILPSKKFPSWSLNFENSMNIFDYVNVNSIHVPEDLKKYNTSLVAQVKYYSDLYQWLISYDPDYPLSPMAIGGRSLLGAVYSYLNTTLTTGSPYINYFTGSFNTMYQIGGLLALYTVDSKFETMPDYGATYVFDLLNDSSNNTFVMFSFKNGTQPGDELKAYPIFNSSSTLMTWKDFSKNMDNVSIWELEKWCSACNSTADQCVEYSDTYNYATKLEGMGVDLESLANGDKKITQLTDAAAGGIGAGVTIGVFLILGALGYLFLRFFSKNKKQSNPILPIDEPERELSSTVNSAHNDLPDHLRDSRSNITDSIVSKEQSSAQITDHDDITSIHDENNI